jgi:hypothetical protein
MGQPRTPPHLRTGSTRSSDNRINRAQEQQKLDGPLHMRTHWIRGFMAFHRVRRTRIVMLMVSA